MLIFSLLVDVKEEEDQKVELAEEVYKDVVVDEGLKIGPKLDISSDSFGNLPDVVTIRAYDRTYLDIRTVKSDKALLDSGKLKVGIFDIYYYSDKADNSFVSSLGYLEGKLAFDTKQNRGLKGVFYDKKPILVFDKTDLNLIHKVRYSYNTATDDMDVYVYTNTLFVYHFRNNYYKYEYRWDFISESRPEIVKPDSNDPGLKKFLDSTGNYLIKTRVDLKPKGYSLVVGEKTIDVMPDTLLALSRRYNRVELETMKKYRAKDARNLAVTYYLPNIDVNTQFAQYGDYYVVKDNNKPILSFDLNNLNRIIYIECVCNKFGVVELYLYSNALYVYLFEKKLLEQDWKFISIQPVMGLRRDECEKLKQYYTLMNKDNGFDFDVDVYQDILSLLPSEMPINTLYCNGFVMRTMKWDIQLSKKNELKLIDVDTYYAYYSEYNDYLTYKNIGDDFEANSKTNRGFSGVKYYGYYSFKLLPNDNRVIHRVVQTYNRYTYYYDIYAYMNTLYMYHYRRYWYDAYDDWKFVKKEKADIIYYYTPSERPRDLKKYFRLTQNIDNFEFL